MLSMEPPELMWTGLMDSRRSFPVWCLRGIGLAQAASPALKAFMDSQVLQALAPREGQMEGLRGGVTAQAGGPCRGARRSTPPGSQRRGASCRHRWPP